MKAAADVTRIHVLGAGRMGQGIALVFAFAGLDVTLIDFKRRDAAGWQAFDARTRDEIVRPLHAQIALGRIDAAQAEARAVRDQRIVALAEEREVIGGHPFEECARLDVFRGRFARLHLLDRRACDVDDLRPVLDRCTHVAEHMCDVLAQRVEQRRQRGIGQIDVGKLRIQCIGRTERRAGHREIAAKRTGRAREKPAHPDVREQADARFGHRHLRRVGHDAQATGMPGRLRNAHAAPHHDAVHQRDVRLRIGKDRMVQRVFLDEARVDRVAVAALPCIVEEAHVAARAERARVRAVHDDRDDVGIVAPCIERLLHQPDHPDRQRVQRLRPVQFEKADAVRDIRVHVGLGGFGGNGSGSGIGHDSHPANGSRTLSAPASSRTGSAPRHPR